MERVFKFMIFPEMKRDIKRRVRSKILVGAHCPGERK